MPATVHEDLVAPMRLSDVELVEHIFDELIAQVGDDDLFEALNRYFAEVLERFAPHVEMDLASRQLAGEGPDSIADHIEIMAQHHAARLAARHERQTGVDRA